MNVATECYLTFLFCLFYQHLCVVDWGMGLFGWFDPLPVEVGAWQVAAVVADDNTVDVQHGHDLEDKVLPEHPRSGTVTQQKVNHVLNDKTRHRLPRMHPCCQYDRLLVLVRRLPNRQIVATKLTKIYLLPDSVKHKNFRWNRFFFTGSISIDRKYCCKCVYVYG